MQNILDILSNPSVVVVLAAALVWLLRTLFVREPILAKYTGYIITGVKMAEKAIPDDTTNKGLAKADHALKYVLEIWEKVEGKAPSEKDVVEIKNKIAVVHDNLEKNGQL